MFFCMGLTVFRGRVRLLFKTCSFVLIAGLAVMVVGLFSPGLYAVSGVMIAVGYCGFDVLVWTMIAFHGHFPDNRMPRVVAMAMLGEQLGIGCGAALGILMASLALDSSVAMGILMGLNILAVGVLVGFTEYGSRLWGMLTRAEVGGGSDGPGLGRATGSDGTAQGIAPGTGWGGVDEPDATAIRVASFAGRYRLTEREREILASYAQGRSMAYIADKLCVSENTIKTHVRHIYAKCGAHNKQELLDLVESC